MPLRLTLALPLYGNELSHAAKQAEVVASIFPWLLAESVLPPQAARIPVDIPMMRLLISVRFTIVSFGREEMKASGVFFVHKWRIHHQHFFALPTKSSLVISVWKNNREISLKP